MFHMMIQRRTIVLANSISYILHYIYIQIITNDINDYMKKMNATPET